MVNCAAIMNLWFVAALLLGVFWYRHGQEMALRRQIRANIEKDAAKVAAPEEAP